MSIRTLANKCVPPGTKLWIYNNWNLCLPRPCEYIGGSDVGVDHEIDIQGWTCYYPGETLYLEREDALQARAIVIRQRIQKHKERITCLEGEIRSLSDMLK